MSQVDTANFELKVFKDHDLQYILIGDEPWFKAKQVAEILEYKDCDQAIRKHVNEEDKQRLNALFPKSFHDGVGIHGNIIMINESGLYDLVLASKKKEAKHFKRWVTKEVLPAVRRTGKYENEQLKLKLEQANKTIEWYSEHQVVGDSWFQKLPPKEAKFIPKKLTDKEMKNRIHKDMIPLLSNPFDYVYVPRDR